MSLFGKLSNLSRSMKQDFFYQTFEPTEKKRVLDVGGEIGYSSDRGLQLIDSYPWKSNISAINLFPDAVFEIKEAYPEVDAVAS